MMSQASKINWNDMVEAIPAFLTFFMIPFTYSITNGILFGLAASFLLYLTTGQCLRDMSVYFGRKDEFEAPPRRSLSAATGLSPHASRHSYQSISDEH